jgi:hypothetical protein
MMIRIPTIKRMNDLAIEFIFDRDRMTEARKRELLDGIDQWKRRRDATQVQLHEIDNVINAIVKDSKGGFAKIKETIVRHGLDYKFMFKDGI